ncbi:TAF5-like RNA polymerase II p300/CBP-associated factor-associated factor 65 kDa subunit 5L isoform X2 [Bemisia tabaci]
MALFASADKDASRLNSVVFSSVRNDVVQMDDQFSKFQAWLSEVTDPECKIELSAFLFPLLCHLYIDSLRNGATDANSSMFKKHETVLKSFKENEELLGALKELTSIQDIDNSTVINTFRSCKYEIKLSPKSLNILRKYLTNHGHVVLLQVIQMWFDIKTIPDKVLRPECEEEISSASSLETNFIYDLAGFSNEDKEMTDLLDTIKAFSDGPPVPQPMLLYSINNANELIYRAKVSNSVNLLAAGCADSSIRLWSLNQTNFSKNRSRSVSKAMLCSDNSINSFPEKIKPWLKCNGNLNNCYFSSLHGHHGAVTDVAFVPNTELLVSTSWDSTMRAWHLSDFSCAAKYIGHNYPVWSLDTSPLGFYVATGSADNTVRLWTLDRTYPIRIFAGHTQNVYSVAFHPNGSYLASGSCDKSIRLWSVVDGSMVRVFSSGSEVRTLAFSPNGQLLASGGDSKRIQIWDLSTGLVVCTIEAHFGIISSIAWNLDGEILAAGSLDGNVTLWHVQLKNEIAVEHLATFSTNCESVTSLQYAMKNICVCIGSSKETE